LFACACACEYVWRLHADDDVRMVANVLHEAQNPEVSPCGENLVFDIIPSHDLRLREVLAKLNAFREHAACSRTETGGASTCPHAT